MTTTVSPDGTNISGVAKAMADSFEYNSNEDHSGLTQEGYDEIKGLFGAVPEEDRAEVYMEFCKELFDRGIPYQNVMAQ
jgi:hypothetical protein